MTADEDSIEGFSFFTYIFQAIWPTGGSVPNDVTISSPRTSKSSTSTASERADLKRREVDGTPLTTNGDEGNTSECSGKLRIVPSDDVILRLKYKGRTIRVKTSIDIQSGDSKYDRERRVMTLSTFLGTHSLFTSLINTARKEFAISTRSIITIYTPSLSANPSWGNASYRPIRPWHSVILPTGQKEWLYNDAKEFLAEKDFYLKRGVPHRRGYLLYGEPGSGKSSLIAALAAKLKLDIHVVNFGAKQTDDDKLNTLLQACPTKCILLMEDIDCAFRSRELSEDESSETSDSEQVVIKNSHMKSGKPTKSKSTKHTPSGTVSTGVTLSGLLNALDGVTSSEGRLLFCTTNWRKKIDPALARPGRCDIWIEFKNATCQQARDLFIHFYDARHTSSPIITATSRSGEPLTPEQAKPENENEKANIENNPDAEPPIDSPEQDVDPSISLPEVETPAAQTDIFSLAETFATIIPEGKVSVSSLQGYLMRYKWTPLDAVEAASRWGESGFDQWPTITLKEGKVDLQDMRLEGWATDTLVEGGMDRKIGR
ncbi:hypothetical protein I203_105032 [Kwoniella mangroviensis CBS 8507]|uniref:uncharacterized protein n=1 Tax=Kwoniella mangroviensis CBS 8507 TaxID=1296122 RepID=UPI00080CFC42|nr:uncharacterized protein I203_00021 [Kwoniella mangroviensis CBS 8507]OCF69894.1 hypothetical protein I203_00021 [Kwoniella mangroviensis CBS 8507]